MHKLLLLTLSLFLLGLTASAEDKKIDAKLLVGKWEPKAKGEEVVIEFTADGKMVSW